MGRLVHCQETCSHMKDFKESVGTVFRHAVWRGYSRRLIQSIWSRFLFSRWHSADIRVKELRAWFSKVWGYICSTSGESRPDPTVAVPNLGANPDSPFLEAFGVLVAAATREPHAQRGTSSREDSVPQSSAASDSTVPMDRDEVCVRQQVLVSDGAQQDHTPQQTPVFSASPPEGGP